MTTEDSPRSATDGRLLSAEEMRETILMIRFLARWMIRQGLFSTDELDDAIQTERHRPTLLVPGEIPASLSSEDEYDDEP